MSQKNFHKHLPWLQVSWSGKKVVEGSASVVGSCGSLSGGGSGGSLNGGGSGGKKISSVELALTPLHLRIVK